MLTLFFRIYLDYFYMKVGIYVNIEQANKK